MNVMEAMVLTIEETNAGDVIFKPVKYMFKVRLILYFQNVPVSRYLSEFDHFLLIYSKFCLLTP